MNRTAIVSAFFVCASLFAVRAHAADSTDTQGLRAHLVQLSRSSGDTVTLQVEVDNDTEHDATAPGMSQSKLDDPVQRKEYLVLNANGALASSDLMSLRSHRHMLLWAKFPAPPAGISAVTVSIPGFIPMDDVPLR